MSAAVNFHPLFDDDVHQARDWFDSRDPGLGSEFVADLYAVIQQVVEFPEAHPVKHGEIREALVQRFRFRLFYRLRGDHLLIIGTMHGSREVHHWLRTRADWL